MSAPPARETFRVWLPIDVRWGDMDAMGHVNNAAYFTYCESARIHYFARIELFALAPTPAHGPAVVTASCTFRQQVRHPAALEVGVRAVAIGTKSFTLAYGIYRRDQEHDREQAVADGSSVVVWVDYAAGKSQPLPAAIAARIHDLDDLAG